MNTLPFPHALAPILPDPAATARLGLEVEMFGFDAETLAPLGTSQASLSPQQLMQRIADQNSGAKLKVDEPTGEVIGVDLGCGNFSLEPGGQVEYASCPQSSVAGVLQDLVQGLEVLEQAAAGQVLFLDHGTNPVAGADLPLLVPKHRYRILDRYFASQPGGRGQHMMRYSATAQPNLDVLGQAEWLDAVNLTFALTPFVRHLFANSRYFHGQLQPAGSERQRIWAAIDASRTGIPAEVAFYPDLVERYAEWAAQAHVFLVSGLPLEEQPTYGELRFSDWLAQPYKGVQASEAAWETHLATLFPDLRLRRFLEIRMVDAQPFAQGFAPLTFWSTVLSAREPHWVFLRGISAEAGLTGVSELLHLPAEHELFRRPAHLHGLLQCVLSQAQDDLSRRSLPHFSAWVAPLEGLDYPQSGLDFVRAQATKLPSQQIRAFSQ